MSGRSIYRGTPGSAKDVAVLRWLCETRGLSLAEAARRWEECGEERKAAYQRQAHQRQVEERRRRAGYPAYRPRSDYLGGV